MVAGDRQRHHRSSDTFAVSNAGLGPAGAHAEDASLGRIDDRKHLADTVHAEIRDRKGGAVVFVRRELAVARASSQLSHLLADRRKAETARVAYDGRDEAFVEGDGNGDVD